MQTRELREYAERRGWQIVGEYVDIGMSSTKERRPELDRLMTDAHRRRFEVLAMRSGIHLEYINHRWTKAGEQPKIDQDNAQGVCGFCTKARNSEGVRSAVVSVELKDGRCFDQAVASEGCIIQVRGYMDVPFSPDEVTSVTVNHKRWNFRAYSDVQPHREKSRAATA